MNGRIGVMLRLWVVVLAFLSMGLPKGIQAQPREERDVCFRWGFGAITGPIHDRRLTAVTQDRVLKTGDQLKMLVELKKRCFVYVISHTSDHELYLLFPYDLGQFDQDYVLSKKYTIPRGDMWLELDQHTGLETFYLLASATRLIQLETLLEKYEKAHASERKAVKEAVLSEIRDLKKRHKKLSTSAERPVPIGGNVRGTKQEEKTAIPDIDALAGEVSTTNFYGRTFTIDHR